jgi:hypothetical protein
MWRAGIVCPRAGEDLYDFWFPAFAGTSSHQYHTYTRTLCQYETIYFCVLCIFTMAQGYALWYKSAIGGRLAAPSKGLTSSTLLSSAAWGGTFRTIWDLVSFPFPICFFSTPSLITLFHVIWYSP